MSSESAVAFRDVSFRYEAASEHLFCNLSAHFPRGFTGIIGANGAGKTTLLHLAIGATLEEARALPHEQLGHVMNVVSRLGSRPSRLLESRQPSPGEIRKLLLALGIARAPHLIVMDEPTNHLDLPSIEALESALAECPCGLLLVSHNERFSDRLVERSWHIEADANRDSFVAAR